MTDLDSFRTTIVPDPPPEKRNPLITHLPDIVAIAVMGTLLILPSEILNHNYPDPTTYIQETQSSLTMIKTALVSQIPSLALIGFTAYARLTKNK